jgi:hypothetical protein
MSSSGRQAVAVGALAIGATIRGYWPGLDPLAIEGADTIRS